MKRPQQIKHPHPPAQQRQVLVSWSKLFADTWVRHKHNPRVIEGMKQFILFKKDTPTAMFGRKDSFFSGSGSPLKGFLHAGLTNDISVIYNVGGANPTVLRLYAIGTHDELGTSPHAKGNNRMNQMRTKIDNTGFDERNKPNELPEGLTRS